MKRILLSLTILAIYTTVAAQSQANNWVFANYELNFNTSPVSVVRESAVHLNRGMGVISDANGALLFYTDGYSVWNRAHQLMPNGSALLTTQGSPTQQSIVIPRPGSTTLFYIFTVEPGGPPTSGLFYSEVNLALNGGLGDVVVKGQKLVSNVSAMISATFHENQKDVWIMAHKSNSNKYQTVLVTDSGISPVTEQVIGPSYNSSSNQLKFSPDGRKMALCDDGNLSLFNFDSSSGILSNTMTFQFTDSPILQGLDFSSDATRLYVYELRSGLYQFDVSLPDFSQIRDSRKRIDFPYSGNSPRLFQLAPDGKIYFTKGGGGGGTQHLGVIHNPNARAEQVNVVGNGLYLDGGDSFVNYTPNFIQNYFFKTSFMFSHACEGQTVQFNVTNETLLDSAHWFFGEGSTSSIRNPEFTYSEKGDYTVKLLAYYGEDADTIIQMVHVNAVPQIDLGTDRTVCKGDEITFDGKYVSHEWNTGDTTQIITASQTQWYTVTVSNTAGCFSVDSLFLTVEDLPVITLPDTVQLTTESLELIPGTFNSYNWSTGESSPTLVVQHSGWYSVQVTNAAGCKLSQSVYVTSDNEPYPPDNVATWKRLSPYPSANTGRDMIFLNRETGFILNDTEILRTMDAGATWNVQQKVPSASRMAFKNDIGYIVGDQGTVYKSTHLGAGWNKLTFPFADNLKSISLVHQDTIYIASETRLFISNDGGSTWIARDITDLNVVDVFFTSAKVGHIACSNGTIQKTTDGGVTWRSTQNINYPVSFFRLKFLSKTLGFAMAQSNDLYRTTNGGESWTKISIPSYSYGFQFINDLQGFVVGEHGSIYKTTDGGLTWNWIGFDGLKYANDLHSVFFLDKNVGFASGLRGRIIKTIDGGRSWKGYSPTYDNIVQLDWVTTQTGFSLVGNTIYKTNNQGISWTSLGPPLNDVKTTSIDFVNENIGYATVGGSVNTSGTSNMVYKTTNGGISWVKAHSSHDLSMDDLTYLYFLDDNVGFASGGYNFRTLLKTVNGGQTWTNVLNANIGQLQFVSELVAYAYSGPYSTGKVYKSINGGSSWELVYATDSYITSIHFLNETVGFWVGDSQLMYKTTNGGNTWTQVTEVPYGFYLSVKFYSDKLGYVLNDNGQVYVTRDGGVSWKLDHAYYGLHTLERFEDTFFAHGDFGAIFSNTIDNSDLVFLQAQVLHVLQEEAVFECSASASVNLESASLILELGDKRGVYSEHSEVGELSGYVNDTYTFSVKNLEPNKTYFYRFFISMGEGSETATPEGSFTTPEIITGKEPNIHSNLNVYPNPTTGVIVIDVPSKSFQYTLSDQTGRVIETVLTAQRVIDLSGLAPGMYLLTIEHGRNRVIRKIIKQ